MTKTNVETLMERFDENLEEFRDEMLGYDKEVIYDLAPVIVATIDAHNLLKNSDYLDECDAAYLLLFRNPLEMISDVWSEYLDEGWTDFEQAICDVLDDDENDEIYERVDDVIYEMPLDDDERLAEYRKFLKTIGETSDSIAKLCKSILEDERY